MVSGVFLFVFSFFLSSVFVIGEKNNNKLEEKEDWGRKKREDVDFDVDLLFHMICLGRDLFLKLFMVVFMVCFLQSFLMPSLIEKHCLGGETKGGTIWQFAESKKNSHKDKPLKISDCDGLFEKIISVCHNKNPKHQKKTLCLFSSSQNSM